MIEVSNHVRGVIFNAKHEVLLQMRADCPIWELPGGNVDNGEFFSNAVKREILEETGLIVNRADLHGVYYRWIRQDDKIDHDVLYGYVCNVTDLADIKLTDEAVQQCFFTRENLPRNAHPYYVQVIEDAYAFQVHRSVQEHDLSFMPRVSSFVETIPLSDIHGFDFWQKNSVTLNLLAQNELPASSKKRFFPD